MRRLLAIAIVAVVALWVSPALGAVSFDDPVGDNTWKATGQGVPDAKNLPADIKAVRVSNDGRHVRFEIAFASGSAAPVQTTAVWIDADRNPDTGDQRFLLMRGTELMPQVSPGGINPTGSTMDSSGAVVVVPISSLDGSRSIAFRVSTASLELPWSYRDLTDIWTYDLQVGSVQLRPGAPRDSAPDTGMWFYAIGARPATAKPAEQTAPAAAAKPKPKKKHR